MLCFEGQLVTMSAATFLNDLSLNVVLAIASFLQF